MLVFAGDGVFGGVEVATGALRQLTVTNTGDAVSGQVAVSLTGSAAFTVLGGQFRDCNGGLVLGSGGSCNLRVAFTPTSADVFTGEVTVGATPGGTLVVPLSGTGQ
jgi:hypothetical protein